MHHWGAEGVYLARVGLPGEDSDTALAMCDSASQYLAAHVVDSKGASAEHAVKQVLRDLRKMGHYGDMKVRMDQE